MLPWFRLLLIVLTQKMDLLEETKLRTGTMQENVGKSSKFKLKHVEHNALLW